LDSDVGKIISELSNKIFIISNLMATKKDYKANLELFYDYLKRGFEVKELRTCPVYFKFSDKEGEQIHTLQLRHFLTNYMFWSPMMKLGYIDRLNESYIVDCSKISADYIKSYVDRKIVLPFRKIISNTKMNKVIADMIHNLSRISTDFNMILGLSINIETFIDVSERIPRFNEIIRTVIPDGLQPTEIESLLDDLMHEQVAILENDPVGNMLQPILKSGAGIKHKQLAEFAISGGLKPDLSGNTIPHPINSNFIVGGLSNITNYYIDSLKQLGAA